MLSLQRTSTQLGTRTFTHSWRWLVSLCLTFLALFVLGLFAQQLGANPDLLAGRNGVYTAAQAGRVPLEAQRAAWLQWLLLNPLVALGLPVLGAWLVLQVSASHMPRVGWLCLALAVGSASLAWTAERFGLPLTWQASKQECWITFLYALSLAALLIWPLAVRLCKRSRWLAWLRLGEPLPKLHRTVCLSQWAFPVFVLISGMGLLWLLDYSARGAAQHRWLGLRHYGVWVLALWVYAFSASSRVLLLQGLAWLLSRLQGTQTVSVLWLALFSLGLLAYLAVVARYGAAHESRHGLTSELLRLPFYVGLGWFFYRYAGQLSRKALLGGLGFISALLLLAIGLSGDRGPALVWIYSGWVFMGVTAVQQSLANSPNPLPSSLWRRVILLIGLLTGLFAIHWLVNQYGGVLSSSLELRVVAMNDLVTLAERSAYNRELGLEMPVTPYDFLLNLHWAMQEAVQHDGLATWLTGYGLGAVPWCGFAGSLGAACQGLPLQTHSDYAFAGLLVSLGLPMVLTCLALLALLFKRLLSGFAVPAAQPVNPLHFGRWVVTVFALMQLVQMAQSVLGTLGNTAMTGVTLPLLSVGSSALLSGAFFLGLGDAVEKISPSVYPLRTNRVRDIS
jgi:hypothetical protein